MVSDNHDVSTTQLLRQVATAMQKPFVMLPIPMPVIHFIASMLGKSAIATRLCGDLYADISHTVERLDWHPPVTFEKGIENTVNAFIDGKKANLSSNHAPRMVFRCLDLLFATVGLLLLSPILLMVTVAAYFDTKSPLFLQTRVGKNQQPFTLFKFRTMACDTASVATHLVSPASITTLGAFLRKTKLDELPQLVNVIKGEMSLVGPRPCLFTQQRLINARQNKAVFSVRPGITGLAQINAIDMSTPKKLANWDQQMIETMSVKKYFTYLIKTVSGSGSGDRIKNV